MEFRGFLLKEETGYLAQRVGDILNALSNLNDGNLGNRSLINHTQNIVSQIRAILHDDWNREDRVYLEKVQKVGVALAKAIDDKDDLKEVIINCMYELKQLSSKLGRPINDL